MTINQTGIIIPVYIHPHLANTNTNVQAARVINYAAGSGRQLWRTGAIAPVRAEHTGSAGAASTTSGAQKDQHTSTPQQVGETKRCSKKNEYQLKNTSLLLSMVVSPVFLCYAVGVFFILEVLQAQTHPN